MTKIVLDAEALKALASDTRLQILKALDARPLTVSELSRLLTLNKATVFEHLKQLMAAELAKREDDPARKWVYYRLTWKGKNVLHPENAQIFLMLGMAALGFGGAILHTAYLAQMWMETKLGGSASASEPSADRLFAPSDQMSQIAADSDSQESVQSGMAASGSMEPSTMNDAPASGGGDNATAMHGNADASPTPDRVTNADLFKVDNGNAGAQAPAGAKVDASHWWDPLLSTQFLILLGVLVFLLLLSLIIWTLYSSQRKEREDLGKLIAGLPPDVNQDEPVLGTPTG